MAERLIVENFGPIKKIEIDLSRITIFIGPQSVGKSTVAKLVAIFRHGFFVFEQEKFEDSLSRHGIETYVKFDTEIRYKSDSYSFSFKDGISKMKKNQNHPFHNAIQSLNNSEKNNHISSIDKLNRDIISGRNIISEINKFKTEQKQIDEVIKKIEEIEPTEKKSTEKKLKELEQHLKSVETEVKLLITRKVNQNELMVEAQKYFSYSVYLPAERTLLPIISSSIMNLINNEVPIPKILVGYASMFEKARQNIDDYHIDFLNVKYKYIENENRIYTSNEDYFKLNNASSGLQSTIPMLLVIEHVLAALSNTYQCSSFIVEEPELNLYPKNQYELSKVLAGICINKNELSEKYNKLIITTHSPYILAAFNNFLLAHKLGDEVKLKVSKVIPQQSWVDPEHFSAYYIDEKGIVSIFNKESGLIAENHLDQTSEIIMEDFNDLMDLYAIKVQ